MPILILHSNLFMFTLRSLLLSSPSRPFRIRAGHSCGTEMSRTPHALLLCYFCYYYYSITFACVCVDVRARECSGSENLILRYRVGDPIGDGALPRGCLMGTAIVDL